MPRSLPELLVYVFQTFAIMDAKGKSEMKKWKVTADAYYDEYSQRESENMEFASKEDAEQWFMERLKRWTDNWTTIISGTSLELETRAIDDGYVQSALNIKIQGTGSQDDS